MTFNPAEWEVIGQRRGKECGLCRRWWPSGMANEVRAHCKSFKPLSGSRPILREKSTGVVVEPKAGSKPIK